MPTPHLYSMPMPSHDQVYSVWGTFLPKRKFGSKKKLMRRAMVRPIGRISIVPES